MGPHVEAAPPVVAGSSLKFANHFYPTAASLGGVRVVCVCGNAIRGCLPWGGGGGGSGSDDSYSSIADVGDPRAGASSGGSSSSSSGPGGSQPSWWDAYFAYEGYKSGCGRGDVDGDGVTPLCISQLPGAEQLVLLGVWHSPRGKASQPWYGDVIDQWQCYLASDTAVAPLSGCGGAGGSRRA